MDSRNHPGRSTHVDLNKSSAVLRSETVRRLKYLVERIREIKTLHDVVQSGEIVHLWEPACQEENSQDSSRSCGSPRSSFPRAPASAHNASLSNRFVCSSGRCGTHRNIVWSAAQG